VVIKAESNTHDVGVGMVPCSVFEEAGVCCCLFNHYKDLGWFDCNTSWGLRGWSGVVVVFIVGERGRLGVGRRNDFVAHVCQCGLIVEKGTTDFLEADNVRVVFCDTIEEVCGEGSALRMEMQRKNTFSDVVYMTPKSSNGGSSRVFTSH